MNWDFPVVLHYNNSKQRANNLGSLFQRSPSISQYGEYLALHENHDLLFTQYMRQSNNSEEITRFVKFFCFTRKIFLTLQVSLPLSPPLSVPPPSCSLSLPFSSLFLSSTHCYMKILYISFTYISVTLCVLSIKTILSLWQDYFTELFDLTEYLANEFHVNFTSNVNLQRI